MRARTRMRNRVVEILWTDIEFDHGKYEWVITFRYEKMITIIFYKMAHGWRRHDLLTLNKLGKIENFLS